MTEEILNEEANNQSLGIENNELSFKLENFEGPLDLLLHLIRKNKMEIENVKLSLITEQYLQIITEAQRIDMEVASEFIEMAAYLIEIKSKSLLPKLNEEEVEEIDEESLLLQRLKEYEAIKESLDKMKAIENVDRFYKQPDKQVGKFRFVLKDMSFDKLLDAFSKLIVKTTFKEEKPEPKEIKREVFTVAQKIATLKDTLLIRKKVMFSQLFSEARSKDEVVTTFMALLELLKLQEIKVQQVENFADIEIIKNEDLDKSEKENG